MRTLSSLAVVLAVVFIAVSRPSAAPREVVNPPGQPEGIKVHGHWVIEVRDPDGAVVARHDFQNAFHTGDGRNLLAQTLGKRRQIMEWRVYLGDIGESGACGQGPCVIDESFSGLDVNGSGGELTLSGSATAVADGSFNRVATQAVTTPGGFTFTLTEKFLATPINLVAGQSVRVTVRISFS